MAIIHKKTYTPDLHAQLLEFMSEIYPNRSSLYLDWWLTNIDKSGSVCWDKCYILFDEEKIIGCTTVNEIEVIITSNSNRKKLFVQANTILLSDYRGNGLSRIIYEGYNYPDWITLGFTKMAWAIQPKYVKHFVPINPVNVYMSLSVRGLWGGQVWNLIRRKNISECSFPPHVDLGNDGELSIVKDLSELPIPSDGRWTKDGIEIARNSDYFQKRYIDIYRNSDYHIYNYCVKGENIGYIVVRHAVLKKIDMVSLVDFRFKSRNDEIKSIKAAVKLACLCGIGFVITLTSRSWGNRFSPLTIMTPKKLFCAVGTPLNTDNFNEMLVTSADSDLDFVYYK